MRPWSKIRSRLENEYLAESLRGRLTYFVTTYHATHDGDEGRVAVRLDGCEILKSNYYDRFGLIWSASAAREAEGMSSDEAWRQAPYDVMDSGEFYQVDFYRAFDEFDSQSITESLHSKNAVVRMFALLDRRTGKRTLESLRQQMQQEQPWLQMIYYLRLEAEGLPLRVKENNVKKGILFDLDGTLWDSSEQVTQAWNVCLRDRLHRSEQITVDDMHRFMGKTIPQIAAMLFPDLPEEERVSYLTACTDYERDYLNTLIGSARPRIFAGEQETIRSLQQDYTLGIVSNCQIGYIEVYLSQQAFADAFSDHECAEKTGLSKGQNIRLVMERLGITDCIYIGDTQGDADAAKEAGVKFIYAAYGFGSVDACDAEIDDIRKLPETAAALFDH